MERFFNTAGPNRPSMNYTIDPLSRFDLDDVLMLIRQQKYFVLHAPRQTGKTMCLLVLRDYLNSHGDYIDTHIDIFIDKLKEPRVKRVIEPIRANSDAADNSLLPTGDIQYS